MNKKIEDIFREGLGDAHSNPSPQTWTRIKYRLWWKDVVTTLTTASVEPSMSTWTSISRQLMLQNFLRFSIGNFNIYYLGLFVAIISGGLLTYPDNSEKEAAIISGRSEFAVGPLPDYSGMIASDVKQEQNNTSANKIINYQSISIASNINDEAEIIDERTNNIEVSSLLSESEQPINNEIPDLQEINQINSLKPNLISGVPNGFLTYNDSIYDWKGKPVTVEKYRLSADVFVSMSNNDIKYKVKSTEKNLIKDPQLSAGNMFSAGLSLNYQISNFSLHGAVSYSGFDLSSAYKSLNYKTDSVVFSWVIDGGYFDYDTLWVLNLDSLINGNPVYVEVVDSHFVHSNDTISVTKPINSKEITESTAYARLSYLEFPISAGYSVSSGKIDYRLKLSVIPGLLTYTRGDITNPFAVYGSVAAQKEIFSKWLLSGSASLEIHYKPFARMGVSLEPFYRHSFNNIFNDQIPFNTELNSWGCKFSIRYYLL